MKKDVVFLIVDSLCKKNVGINYSGESTTPFLDSIKKECFICDKVYSQGPYTEAGTKALLCGEDTLSSGGYLLRYANANSFITNEFYDNGYETFCYMYPSALLSKETIEKTDHMIYTSGFEFNAIWKQKLSFYLQRFKSGILDKMDLDKCIQVMKLVFFAWDKFFNPDDEEEAYRLIKDCLLDFDFEVNRSLLAEQISKFNSQPDKYIISLFEEELRHALFSIETVDMRKMVRNDVILDAFKNVPTIERKYKRVHLSRNIRNNSYSVIKQGIDIWNYIKTRNKYMLGRTYNFYKLLGEANNMSICKKKNDYKVVRSSKTILDDVAQVMLKETNKPKFVFIHTEDTHYFSTCFTYDSDNRNLILSELNEAKDYLDKVGKSYRGNLMYDLSIRYVDNQLKDLFEKLKQNNKIETTTMCITADHGYSYNRYPLRERLVNNFYEENYIIPFFLFDMNIKCKNYSYFMLSKDLLATLYDWCGLEVSNSVTGRSVLKGEKIRDYIITEYMGPGCPDMRHREVWMSARSETRMVAIRATLKKEQLELDDIVEAYDLIEDPLEEHKLCEYDKESVELFEALKKRWSVLKEETI